MTVVATTMQRLSNLTYTLARVQQACKAEQCLSDQTQPWPVIFRMAQICYVRARAPIRRASADLASLSRQVVNICASTRPNKKHILGLSPPSPPPSPLPSPLIRARRRRSDASYNMPNRLPQAITINEPNIDD